MDLAGDTSRLAGHLAPHKNVIGTFGLRKDWKASVGVMPANMKPPFRKEFGHPARRKTQRRYASAIRKSSQNAAVPTKNCVRIEPLELAQQER